jgi:hypothetical protein
VPDTTIWRPGATWNGSSQYAAAVSGRPAFAADTVAAMYQGHACALAGVEAVAIADAPAAEGEVDAAGVAVAAGEHPEMSASVPRASALRPRHHRPLG